MFDRPSYHITANVTVTTGTLSATNLPMELTTTDTDQWNLVVMTGIGAAIHAIFYPSPSLTGRHSPSHRCRFQPDTSIIHHWIGKRSDSQRSIRLLLARGSCGCGSSGRECGRVGYNHPAKVSIHNWPTQNHSTKLNLHHQDTEHYKHHIRLLRQCCPVKSSPLCIKHGLTYPHQHRLLHLVSHTAPALLLKRRRACRFILNRNKCTCRHILIVTALFTVPTNHLIVTQATLSSPMSESDKLTTPFTVMSSGTATQTKVILDESVLTACFAHSMLMQTGAVQANLLTGETLSLTGVTFTSYSSLGNGGALLVLSSALTTLKPATLPTSKAATHTHPNGAKHANCGLLQLPAKPSRTLSSLPARRTRSLSMLL
ncbi:hypothetical protein BLNAU_24448 [Blattamonas nauphoetae]|uniref:Uncharacterized protein n=1 Tax=Blattamonas nauphoetae TaxID=2049346 RepID=A0ABQ9WMG6_9EUKA|nr:hypothetical protein BLNAU_24448 [Blattamonas nauphoetae]